MGALSADNAALILRDTADVRTGEVKASTAVYGASFVMRDNVSKVVPLSTAAGTFDGILGSGGTSTTATDRKRDLYRKGMFKGVISSIALTDIGKPVYCGTDNPADVTLTWSAGVKRVGDVSGLVYDSSGAVTNECWVYFDADDDARSAVAFPAGSVRTADAATVDSLLYVVPTGRQAKVVAGTWEVGPLAPTNVTTVDLYLKKISGVTRTTLAGPINIKSYATVDLTVAMTLSTVAGVLALAAGDRLIASVDCQGTASAFSDVKVIPTVSEWPQG